MPVSGIPGYAGRLLRIDLSSGTTSVEPIKEDILKSFIGGTGLAAKFLCDEVQAGTHWDDPGNRLIFNAGPLSGTKVSGGGTLTAASLGAMTEMFGSSQANGFFGAYLKRSGFDAVIVQGKSKNLVYLDILEGKAEIRDASHLSGKDTLETENIIREEAGGGKVSVYCIGPAGENKVRFAAIVGDGGHVAAHNGLGAVMGAKKLKAIAVHNGSWEFPVFDDAILNKLAKELFSKSRSVRGGFREKWGTAGTFGDHIKHGSLPVRNYTTNLFPEYERFTGQYLRTNYRTRPKPCWRCGMHCRSIEISKGPWAGHVGEEPEYECVAACSSLIGNTDTDAMIVLASTIDRLGLDVNETGWIISFVMECFEKGYLTKEDLDGLDMRWGNVQAAMELLQKISAREGVGDLLAEGVKRASESIGGEAPNLGVYTMKGATPRSHDHRALWWELFDTCMSNTGTIEDAGGKIQWEHFSIDPVINMFSSEQVPRLKASVSGWRQFEDSLGVCRFCIEDMPLLLATVNAVTGWDLDIEKAVESGRRVVNLMRVFNFRHGLKPESEWPSDRYGSAPVNGPVKGISIIPSFDDMRKDYWRLSGWDEKEGRPLPETLEKLNLSYLVAELWPPEKD